ncbi:MAG: hypothetical protein K5929_06315 [Lachnospiraceae bacterium]|nr:hypothetical protein [Lachnospiraceae bacterium]
MKSTVYLHIGTPKTGSTSIQNFLYENRDLLSEKGLFYPDMGFDYRNIVHSVNGHFLMNLNPNNKKCEKGHTKTYDEGFEKLYEMAEEHDKILLSEEKLWYWYRTDAPEGAFWIELKEKLTAHDIDCRIIVYLRRQDSFMQSLWSQRVKVGIRKDSLEEFLKESYPNDYYRYLNALSDVFGKDHMIVRSFERSRFKNGDLLEDFLEIFDMDIHDGFKVGDPEQNQKLEGSYLEMRRMMGHLPEYAVHSPYPGNLFQKIQSRNYFDEDFKKYHPIDSDKLSDFLKGFEESNSLVAREYLGREDGKLFDDTNLPEYKKTDVDTRDLLNTAIMIYARMFNKSSIENAEMKTEIKNLKKEIRELRKEIEQLKSDSKPQKKKWF